MVKFFHTPKPRQFNYKPRYYDPEKEAMEKRRQELRGIRVPEGEDYVPGDMLRQQQMQRMIASDDRTRRKKRGSTMMLIVILLLLALAVLWVIS